MISYSILFLIIAVLVGLMIYMAIYLYVEQQISGQFRIRREYVYNPADRYTPEIVHYVIERQWCGTWWEISRHSDLQLAHTRFEERKVGIITPTPEKNIIRQEKFT